MEGKPLTKEALALTEKKMDMALDDIIKMSKANSAKGKRTRVSNKSQRAFNNAAQDKSTKLRGFMNSRTSLRQGVLARRRSNFQENQFPLANEAAWKAAGSPFPSRAPHRDRTMNLSRARARPPLSRNRSSNNTSVARKQQQNEGNGNPKHRPQTLDACFANLNEQRKKASVLSRPRKTTMERNGRGDGRQIPPWTRFPN